MAAYGARQLLDRPQLGVKFKSKRWSWLIAFINSLWIVGIVVLIQDLFFLVITSFRWVPVYPQYATWSFWLCFPRDLAALALCFLLSHEFYGKTYSFNMRFWTDFFLLWGITICVFAVVPNMGFTNWTFAITEHMDDSVIRLAFAMNFLFGKPFLFYIYTKLWKREKGKDLKTTPMR